MRDHNKIIRDGRPLKLADIIDVQMVQSLMDAFFELTHIGIGIIDMEGTVLVATGWQEICMQFHRCNQETRRHCIESDTLLSVGVEPGAFKSYRCKNGMWDIATPIVVRNRHLGNIFLGQFLFEDEQPNYDIFREQAHRYGFNETLYLEALERVPRWNQATVRKVLDFYTQFANLIAVQGVSNAELAESVEVRKRAEAALIEANNKLEVEVAVRTRALSVSNEELTMVNEEVKTINDEVTLLNLELQNIKETLEQRIAERTAELTAAHNELAAQYMAFRQTQEKLHEQETSYFAVVQNLADGVCLRDQSDRILYANQAFAEMVQADDSESLRGQYYSEFVPLEEREETRRRMNSIFKGAKIPWREHRLIGLRRQTTFVVSIGLLVEQGGKPCIISVFHDVTDVKIKEDKLQRNAAVQTVLRGIADAALLNDSLDNLYVKMHHLIKKILPAQNFYITLLDETTGEVKVPYCVDETRTVPASRPISKGLTEYIICEGKTVLLSAADLCRLQSAGKIVYFVPQDQDWLGAPLVDVHGKIFGVLAIFSNSDKQGFPEDAVEVMSIIAAQISLLIQRKHVEQELTQNEARYRAVLEQGADAVILCDPVTGELLEANSRFTQLSGYDLLRDGPLTLFDLIVDSRDNIQAYQCELKRTGFLPPERRAGYHKSGRIVTVERSCTLIRLRDRSLIAVNIRDVSEEVRREQEISRDAKMASKVQKALLSKINPSPYLEVSTIYAPISYVGGDLYFMDWRYDAQVLRGFLIDTTGHGLATALHTSAMHVLLREINEMDLPLLEQVQTLNQRLLQYFDTGTFAGALAFELDLQTRELRWVGAGIPKIWAATQQFQGTIITPGMFLGVQPDEFFEINNLSVNIGDCFYFMTDGITDQFGDDKTLPLVHYHEMVDFLHASIHSENCRDDSTAICIRVTELPQTSATRVGWPRIIRFNGYGDYQRLKGEVASVLTEIIGWPHSLVEVAVNEAIANAMECRDGVPRPHQARLRFNHFGSRLVVRVRSSRMGFAGNAMLRRLRANPQDMFAFGEDAGMGRGIPIMLTVADQMLYNTEGNEVLLAWKLGSNRLRVM